MSRIFVQGDSISYGHRDLIAGGWVNRFKANLMHNETCPHEVINFALSNQTLNKIVARFPAQVAPYGRAKSLGVFMLGGADLIIPKGKTEVQNPLPLFKDQLVQLGEIAIAARVTPLFVGLYPVDDRLTNPAKNGDSFTLERGVAYTAAVKQYAQETEAPYVNIWQKWDADQRNLLSSDAVHPNGAGHEIIAQEVTAAVMRRLAAPLLAYTPISSKISV